MFEQLGRYLDWFLTETLLGAFVKGAFQGIGWAIQVFIFLILLAIAIRLGWF